MSTLAPSLARAASATHCLHCATPLGRAPTSAFCCLGCEYVHALVEGESLARYYDLGGGRGSPVADPRGAARDDKWIEALDARSGVGARSVDLDVQGIHCSGCVWLLEELFRRHAGGGRIVVNPALGRLQLAYDAPFALRAFVHDVERFGYRLGPPLKASAARANDLLVRFGICVALAMNAMIFSIATYAGLHSGPSYALFRAIVFALSALSLVVGGPVFFRAAWHGLRRGIAHLDLPISLGLLLAFAGSTYSFVHGEGGASYFDTLNVFIALMLLGRYLQERVLERNKRLLLESDGASGLLTRRVDVDGVALVPCSEIAEGDALLVAPGDLVPVAATLTERRALFSLDWITGESAARPFDVGDAVPAGAFLADAQAVTLHAREPFEASALVALLNAPRPGERARDDERPRATVWWQTLAKVYVAGVLVAATVGFVAASARGAGLAAALDVTTAVLVVTCPCAFGIATPLAYELVQAGLRRAGLYVRSPGFLDRATRVKRVVFDKTGTLTTGRLRACEAFVAAGVTDAEWAALYNMVARSTHPKSAAVKSLLDGRGFPFAPALAVVEHAGAGLELRVDDVVYRFGAPPFATRGASRPVDADVSTHADLAFTVDGALRAAYRTVEELRPNAADDVGALTRAGYDVLLLSGDAAARVDEAARAAGIPIDHAFGECTPTGKAAWLAARDRDDTLMIGDGINDALVVDAAYCSGTPAVDRPFMPTRADFYFTTAGLAPIRLALDAAHVLARVTRRNLTLAVLYNVIAVALAYSGRMSPLVCAVFMPASSLSVLLITTASLSRRSPLWKSSLSKSS